MHPGFERDYRYLLSRLIPRYLLSSQRIEGIRNALAGRDRLEVIRQAYLSLEELTAKGVYHKRGMQRSYGNVLVSYARAAGRTRITLELSRSEWNAISEGEKRQVGIVPSVLAGIISSLSLNDSPKRVNGMINEMLELATHIRPGATGYLVLLQDLPFIAEREDGRIKVSSPAKISSNAFYRSALNRNASYRFLRPGTISSGASLFPLAPETTSVILIPLSNGGLKWGIFEIHLTDGEPPDAEALDNFSLLGRGVVRLLENNKRLEKMVAVDRLTQVNNRNYFESQLPLEMERATRNKTCLTFLMLDIDDFKRVNDQYGHDVGDAILRLVAQSVKKRLRKIDLFFRYGGEEFIALLPGVGQEDAGRTADRIRHVVSQKRHVLENGEELRITVSIGGCIYPIDAQNETELFRRADQALYLSKKEGKNRVTFYQAET
jgi:diguanylate cyclase (GGDEF)-like protein